MNDRNSSVKSEHWCLWSNIPFPTVEAHNRTGRQRFSSVSPQQPLCRDIWKYCFKYDAWKTWKYLPDHIAFHTKQHQGTTSLLCCHRVAFWSPLGPGTIEEKKFDYLLRETAPLPKWNIAWESIVTLTKAAQKCLDYNLVIFEITNSSTETHFCALIALAVLF